MNRNGIRFKFILGTWEEFKTKLDIEDSGKEFYEAIFGQYANRYFRWENEFQCIQRTKKIWEDVFWLWEQTQKLKSDLKAQGISSISSIETEDRIYNNNNQPETTDLDERFLTGSHKSKVNPINKIESIKAIDSLKTQQRKWIGEFSELFLPFIQ